MTLSLAVNIMQVVYACVTDNMAKCFQTLSQNLCVFINDTVAKRSMTLSKAVHVTKCIVYVTDTASKHFMTLPPAADFAFVTYKDVK